MKRTDDDHQFGIEFAKRLRPFFRKALEDGNTEKEFAKRLGVDRGGLQRYLNANAMPSFRTIVLAYREFQIAIPYAGAETTPIISGRARRRRMVSDLQIDLPLTIESPRGEINVVIKRKTPQRIKLQLRALKLG